MNNKVWIGVGVVGLAVVALSGCRGIAASEMRSLVRVEEKSLSESPARFVEPEVQRYVDEVARLVLISAESVEESLTDEDYKADGLRRIQRAEGSSVDHFDRFDVYVVHSEAPNAWVHGDDFTVITTDLLLFAQSPEELFFVLAHEFGHIRQEHIVDSAERRLNLQVAGAVAVGVAAIVESAAAAAGGYQASGDITRDAARAVNQMVASYQPHRKDDEFEADLYAVRLYLDMGLDPTIADDMFARMLAEFGEGEGDTHPRKADRIAMIQQEIMRRSDGYKQTRRLARAPFEDMQRRVRSLLTNKLADGSIVSHEEHQDERRALNEKVGIANACGPFDADQEVIADHFQRNLRRR